MGPNLSLRNPLAALLLDLDGTLFEIAPRPSDVVVPPGLVALLGRLKHELGGALAILSGRPLAQIDALLAPLVLAAAAEHGAVLRGPEGAPESSAAQPFPAEWVAMLDKTVGRMPGALIEKKCYSVAIHFRLAPDRGPEIETLLRAMLAQAPPGYELLAARMAFEIRCAGVSKGRALCRLMQKNPFAGRKPVFIGDDATDEEAIAAALALGGIGLSVGRDFAGEPAAVRAWLARAADDLHNFPGHG